jgi:hypothetical protein
VPRFDAYKAHGKPLSHAVGYSLLWQGQPALPGHDLVFDINRWSVEAETLTAVWFAILVAFGRWAPFIRLPSGQIEITHPAHVTSEVINAPGNECEIVRVREVTPVGKQLLTLYAAALIGIALYPRWVEVFPVGTGKWDTRPVRYAPLWEPPSIPGLSIHIDGSGAGEKLIWSSMATWVIFIFGGSRQLTCSRRPGDAEWYVQESYGF